MDNTVKEPLIHLSKREDMPSGKRWLVRIAAIFLSLVVCAGFIFMIIKMNPVEVYEGIVEGAVGMVEMALARLNEQEIVQLDEDRKAAMVSNLLVVLCGNKDAQPIVNSGTIV